MLGFEALARGLGREIVGDCTENERTNPANGDVEQQTTRGLFVWRKAGNITTFTAGAATWFTCPNGIQRRASDEPPRCTTTSVAAPGPNTPTAAPATPAPRPCPNALPWSEAKAHLGQRVTIFGPVVQTTFASSSRGQPTFLDLGLAYPDPNRFTVLIPQQSRPSFVEPPERLFAGRTICVTGTVSLFQGIPQIEVSSPASIVVAAS